MIILHHHHYFRLHCHLHPLPSPSFHSNRRKRRRGGGGIRCEMEDNHSWQSHGEEGRKARIRKREQLWRRFFADPSQWSDNRLTKKNSKQPDFRHKRTLEGLWIDDCRWLKDRIATLDWHSNPSSSNNDEHEMAQKLCKQGRLKDAIHLVERKAQQTLMEHDAPKATYISLLKECAKRKMLAEGKRVHAMIVQSKCDSDIFLANNLIDMYSKCGSLQDACMVFDAMPLRNVFSWTTIISAYADSGKCEEAINLYKEMQNFGIFPDKVILIVVLKACARIAALETGKEIHSFILEKGFHLDVTVQNILIDMYAKCGCLDEARELFNKMSERDVVSWTAMIAGYAQNGLQTEAIALYEQMKQEGMEADRVTFVSVLKACANIGALKQGKQIHSLILEKGFHLDSIVQNTLVDMYAKCGSLDTARELFDNMSERDVVSWNAIIGGYAQNGHGTEAIALYKQMKQEGMKADKVTFVCVVKACADIGALEQGKQIHSLILEKGFHLDITVQSTLVDMYAKCGCLGEAHELFNKMSERDVVSWTAMIAGYAQNGLGTEAIALYEQMKQEGMEADRVTFVSVLKACANIGALEQGKQIHSLILKKGFHLDSIVQNTLVDMYAKCECLDTARELFNKMSERDVVSWNAMIGGYAQNGHGTEAIALYKQMKQEGMEADRVTFVCVLKACVDIGALEQGKQIHSLILEKGFHLDMIVQSTLVDMYAKCGWLDKARELFNKMSERDVVSWNAMIAGYAQNGLGTEAIVLYEQIKKEAIQPNELTFTCVLSACSHSGLVKEGFYVFDFLCRCSGVIPTLEHYACMVDLLGRAGLLVEAKEFIMKMPIQPQCLVWMSLLGAARNVGNAEIGRLAFDHVVKLDPHNAAAYLLLIDILARGGEMDKVTEIIKEMTDRGLKKMPGCSWIEVDNQVHTFVVGDESHPQSQQIWTEITRLLGLMRKVGYVPDSSSVLEDVNEKAKEIALCKHSEKMAIAFGLTSIPPFLPIRIKKNLRVLHDGHNATKMISKITGREIYVMDTNRLHHFKDGLCSCKDYW